MLYTRFFNQEEDRAWYTAILAELRQFIFCIA
jgi:hypothetical protein